MNDFTPLHDETPSTSLWLLWTTILFVGIVFFASMHSLSLSENPDWSVSDDWAEGVEGGFSQSAKTISLPVIALFGVFLLLRKGRNAFHLDDWMTLAILTYILVGAFSVVWSINPSLTIRRSVLVSVWCLTALGIAKHFSMRDVMRMALTITTSFLVIGLLAEVAHGVFRPWASDYRFAGTVHPNAQGINCALMCMASVGMAAIHPRLRKFYLLLTAVGLAGVLLTKSRMSLGSLLAAGGFVYVLRWPSRFKTTVFLAGAAVLCAVLLAIQFTDLDLMKEAQKYVSLGREEEMESLTGRLPLWMELTHYIQDRPVLGYGYRAFWDRRHTLEVGEALGGWQVPHAHSGYLDTMLDFGIPIALAFAFASFMAASRTGNLYRRSGDPGHAFSYALLVYALCDSLLESNFVIPNIVPFVTVCAAFQIALRMKESAPISPTVLLLEPVP
jgi:O-antigen ligase